MEKKLYALITCPIPQVDKSQVVQVSFNKEELEEIADYLNKFKYFSPHARVEEVTETVCEWHWPRSKY